MKAIDRFNSLVDRYKKAYKAFNNKDVIDVRYENGYVLLTVEFTTVESTIKVRVSKFEQMLINLENETKN